ncbi:MAG TPA: energy transducer TonB [Candidatus Sulfotelmatobacter sp.]|jgi:TonB family protein|nr:energy transducer TonB [Candidatus Sulfotelmatobacter sp.]
MYKKLSFLVVALSVFIFAAAILHADNRKTVKTSPPVYPAIATKMRIEGSVKLDATIDPDGTVSDVKVVSGHQLLAGAAVDAVKKWKYEPAGAKSTQAVTVDFALAH